jgi:hypothetical protein
MPDPEPDPSVRGYFWVINQSAQHDISNIQYHDGVSLKSFKNNPIAVPVGTNQAFALTAPATYKIHITRVTGGNLISPDLALSIGGVKFIIVNDTGAVIVDPNDPGGGDGDPVLPTDPDDRPPDAGNRALVRIINQSTLYDVDDVRYNGAGNAPFDKTFIGHPIAILRGSQKLFALKPGDYSFKIESRWNATPVLTLLNGKEYIIIVNDTADPVIIDPAGGDSDYILPVDPDYRPAEPVDPAAATLVRVINQSTLHNVANVQYKPNGGSLGQFENPPANAPVTISKGRQKLFALKPHQYSFKITSDDGTRWNETAVKT